MKLTFYTDRKRHLVCLPYSKENLFKMAEQLNIHKCWYHNGKYPHFDIPKKRIEEIEKQCIIVSSIEIVNIIKGIKI